MRIRIDEGLRKAHFGVTISSSAYLTEHKYSIKVKLDGLFQ